MKKYNEEVEKRRKKTMVDTNKYFINLFLFIISINNINQQM